MILAAVRDWFARIDERPVEAIDRDIDDEFALHIEEMERGFVLLGMAPGEARAEAQRRFGDLHTHRRHCRDVALRERRMKSALQIGLVGIGVLLLGGTLAMTGMAHYHTHKALLHVDQRLDEMSKSLAARSAAPVGPSDAPVGAGNVFLHGDGVEHPGAYATSPGLNVSRLLVVGGVNLRNVHELQIRRMKDGRNATVVLRGDGLLAGTDDAELQPGDTVLVADRPLMSADEERRRNEEREVERRKKIETDATRSKAHPQSR